MAVENLKGSRIVTGLLATTTPRSLAGPGLAGGRVRVWCETVEVTAAATDSSTYHMARLPSNARILGASNFSADDLASSGSPTADIGCYPVNSEFTADPDAINDGIDVTATAIVNRRLPAVKDAANVGKRLWEFISGVSTDPKCEIDVKIAIVDADTNTGGTMTLELYYTLD